MPDKFEQAMTPFFESYEQLLATHQARQPTNTIIKKLTPDSFSVQQILTDPNGDNFWVIDGKIQIDDELTPDSPMVTIVDIHD